MRQLNINCQLKYIYKMTYIKPWTKNEHILQEKRIQASHLTIQQMLFSVSLR